MKIVLALAKWGSWIQKLARGIFRRQRVVLNEIFKLTLYDRIIWCLASFRVKKTERKVQHFGCIAQTL